MEKTLLFLAGIDSAPLDDATAIRIIEGLLGCDHAPGYDAELARAACANVLADLAERDLARALFVRSAARAAAQIAQELRLPADLGYRREAVKLAGKIFDSLAGRRVKGQGPLVAALLAAGARPPAGSDADILVVTEGDEAGAATLAFELHGVAPGAAYRFALSDLDAACRRERDRLYPRDLATRIRTAAAAAAAGALAPAPPLESLVPLVDEIRSGVRSKYADHAPSEELFAELVSRRLRDAAASPGEAKLIGEFLRDVAAARRGGRARR